MTEQTVEDYDEITYCAVHPDRETSLRCNKCGRLMCTKCVVQTPVGYRCRECVRSHDDKFFKAESPDYAIVFAIGAVLSMVAGFIMAAINWIILGLLAGFPLGAVIAGLAMRAVNKRRGRQTAEVTTAGVVIGGFLGAAIYALMSYKPEWEEYNRIAERMGLPLQPTLMKHILNITVTDLAVPLLIGLMALAVYNRIKS